MTESDPVPSYEESRRGSISSRARNSDRDPAPPSLVHHYFKNKELSVEFSSYAKSSTSIPVFHPHSVIEGSVTLALGREQTLREMSITVSFEPHQLLTRILTHQARRNAGWKPSWTSAPMIAKEQYMIVVALNHSGPSQPSYVLNRAVTKRRRTSLPELTPFLSGR
jgi:hypothetical protein